MRSNLDLTGGAIMAEAVMMALARSVGHERAHEAVTAASRRAATSGSGLHTALLGDPELSAVFDHKELLELLDPSSYLGLAAETAVAAGTLPNSSEVR
jgi:adenylosuccinate lyase